MDGIIAFAFVMGLPVWLLVEEIVKCAHVPQPQARIAYEHAHQAGGA